jgi:hypothetical protein
MLLMGMSGDDDYDDDDDGIWMISFYLSPHQP